MTARIPLPYGTDSIEVAVPKDKLLGVFEPRALPPLTDAARAVRAALADPIGAPRIRDLANGAQRVAIAIEDATRPVPNALLLDAILEELEAGGVAPEQVTVIATLGLHRPMTPGEFDAALGRWQGRLRTENHDAKNPGQLVPVGTTRLGTAVSVNRTFMEANLRITTGDVEYHQFAGYGGGAKCVYPGMADAAAIQTNHSRMDLPGTGPGHIDGNPVREEIDEVGRMVGVDFNVSVAMDAEHRIVAVRAGELDRSFRSACKFIDDMYLVDLPHRPDLVIASAGGHPKDIDLYQSQKAIEEASQIVKPGGQIVACARCKEGSGSPLFETWMEEAHTPDDIIRRIKESFVLGGHKAYQIARELQRATVYLYSELPPGRVRAWMMRPIADLSEIEALIDSAQSVAILPQATLTRCQIMDELDRSSP